MPQGVTARQRVGRTTLPSQRRAPSQKSNDPQSNTHKNPMASNSGRKRKRESIEDDQENQQASSGLDLKTMIERRVQEGRQKRQRARLEEQFIGEDELEEDRGYRAEEHESEQNGPEQDILEEAESGGAPKDSQNDPMSTSNEGMSAQEKKWWAMNFEELYKYARSKDFGKTGKEGRKSGRIKIIKWLCEKEGITPYVAPIITSVEATPIIARPTVRPTGAVSHPEAILRTSDPALQLLIDKKAEEYRKLSAASLLKIAMERSYQLLKDSTGKLPSKSITAVSQWLAAWDVLKSPREKKWWLGDGIDLVNKAKAMGYQGPSRKYEVIVWLRSTPEDAEIEIAEVAEPTPNKKGEAALKVSKRHAKGSRRPRYD